MRIRQYCFVLQPSFRTDEPWSTSVHIKWHKIMLIATIIYVMIIIFKQRNWHFLNIAFHNPCHTLLNRRNVYFYIIEERKLQFKIQSIFANVWIADKPNNKTRTFTCFSPGSEIVLLLILVCYLNSTYGFADNGYYLSNKKQRREDNEEDSRATWATIKEK